MKVKAPTQKQPERRAFTSAKQRGRSISRRSSFVTRHLPLSHAFTLPKQRGHCGFTLLELLVVVGIIAIVMVLVTPAFTTIKTGNDITTAAYMIKGILEQARTYALVNNTYTWVGFFEESGSTSSTNPATAGNGRVVICTVASKDGTTVYTDVTSPAKDMDSAGTRLAQMGRLVKLENTHLRTLALGSGNGTDTVPGRPAIPNSAPTNSQIGDASPPDSLRYFHYPPNNTEAAAQYVFKKMFQFSPRGECRPQNDNYALRTVAEVDIQPIRGAFLDNAKSCVIQVSGFSGNMKVYR